MVGKLFDSRDFLISIPADSSPSNLMFLKNSMSTNLVETGASVSVFPHHPGHPPAPSVGVQLRTAEGSAMDTFGSRQIHLQFCWVDFSPCWCVHAHPQLWFISPPAGQQCWFLSLWMLPPWSWSPLFPLWINLVNCVIYLMVLNNLLNVVGTRFCKLRTVP